MFSNDKSEVSKVCAGEIICGNENLTMCAYAKVIHRTVRWMQLNVGTQEEVNKRLKQINFDRHSTLQRKKEIFAETTVWKILGTIQMRRKKIFYKVELVESVNYTLHRFYNI